MTNIAVSTQTRQNLHHGIEIYMYAIDKSQQATEETIVLIHNICPDWKSNTTLQSRTLTKEMQMKL